jgi:hypothetical protein
MATIRVVAVHRGLKAWITFILIFTLVVAVLVYAVLWFIKVPYNTVMQKPAFLAIIYVELYGSSLSRYYGEQPVFGTLKSEQLH